MIDKLAQDQLDRWGIGRALADKVGFMQAYDVSPFVGGTSSPGIVIPYYDWLGNPITYSAGGRHGYFARARLLTADPPPSFAAKKPIRYIQPSGSPIYAYLPKRNDWEEIRTDPGRGIVITEGEAKAVVSSSLNIPTIALGGVYSFATSGGDLIDQLKEVEWSGRPVYICFDSDAITNPNILAAEARLVDELQRKRGARCYLTRIPESADGKKVGLDDFIQKNGKKAYFDLLDKSQSLGALDAKIVALNREVAWIERESMIYVLGTSSFLPKESFISGSRFSTIKHISPGPTTGSAPKAVPVAKHWLTHPYAQRFSEVLFRPGEGETVEGETGGTALNLWKEIDSMPGDVTPFLELTDHLFSELGADQKDLPLNLLAYKAQNQHIKVPLALVLIGKSGSGKTLWGEALRQAFGPYGTTATPASLAGEFQGWLEKSLLVTVNEARGEDMSRASEQLKALISDLRRPMNEKFRPVRQINTYSSYIITSNNHAVGAFDSDDRRMVVVNITQRRELAFYKNIVRWLRDDNGAKKIMHFLQNYDLKGWEPPEEAPLTASKYMAYTEGLTQVQRLAEEMRIADHNMVLFWLAQAEEWARNAELSSNPAISGAGRATAQNIDMFQVRPFYTPEELALMFPVIVQQMLGSRFNTSTPSGAISRELRDAGVPYLKPVEDPRGFKWKGRLCQYLVVSNFDAWRQPIRQADFDMLMTQFPTYGQLKRSQR